MSSIGGVFDRASSSIYPLLARTGGIRSPERSGSRLALTLTEREEISRGLTAQLSLRSTARTLRRSVSTISREVRRNGGCVQYRAAQSEAAAWDPLPVSGRKQYGGMGTDQLRGLKCVQTKTNVYVRRHQT